MTKNCYYEIRTPYSRRPSQKSIWVDILDGAAMAADPLPVPSCQKWHENAASAFEANFWTLSRSRNIAIGKLADEGCFHVFYDFPSVEAIVHGEASGKAKESA